MTPAERAIVFFLRVVGVTGMLAVVAVFLPQSWMNAIHVYVGLGPLPDAPIVSYLARSLSAFYTIVSVLALYVSFDIWRYRPLIRLGARMTIATGIVLLGIDLTAGMPMFWTLAEGPPTVAAGLVMAWLESRMRKTPSE